MGDRRVKKVMDYIVVQAGGKGTRLQHLTENKPKALVPVENLPVLFHLFRKFPDAHFVIIADYKKEVLREYLAAFADVKYRIVEAKGSGTCAGVRAAVRFIPDGQPFMLVWSDLILPGTFELPEEYRTEEKPRNNYIGISETFPCRWSYTGGEFKEECSCEYGVAGFFLFTDKEKLKAVPESGELVRWMQQEKAAYQTVSLAGTREFGLLEEYEKLGQEKCRPFNRITVEGSVLTKEALDQQGMDLAVKECAWYERARGKNCRLIPEIYSVNPLKMEYIHGRNIYMYQLDKTGKQKLLEDLISSLDQLHRMEQVPADPFSMEEAYFRKTMKRLSRIEDLVPFAREKEILVNGKRCRNVYFHKRELEQALEKLTCDRFSFIHGDCTFSNLMVRENGQPVLIDPRGYFGYTEIFGDERYDWAKLYYSIVGNYDRFNLKDFRLKIGSIPKEGVQLDIASNQWEDMEREFFRLTGADEWEIKLLHAVIWLSLTTYAWQDYDSICGAFYNGLFYLEDVL